VKIRRIKVQGQLRQTVSETASQPIKNLGRVACTCHPRYMGSINMRIGVQANQGIKERHWAGRVVEYLPSKCKALSSNPSTSYPEKNGREGGGGMK
jgi:hypothetical protein